MPVTFARKTGRSRRLFLLGSDCVVIFLLFMDLRVSTELHGVSASDRVINVAEDFETFGKDIQNWSHSVFLDEAQGTSKIRLFWTPRDTDVLFRIEAPTKGYIGLGLSRNGRMAGADMAIGWVRDGHACLQDRHATSRKEPKVDKKQDWHLIAGYENETHTSLILKRLYDTCDREDIKITNGTLQILYAYHDDDPEPSSNHLTYHSPSQRGVRSILLTQSQKPIFKQDQGRIYHWDLQSHKVSLPRDDDTLYWCKLFRLPNISTKHHMIGYEPIIQTGNYDYMHHVLVYECHSRGRDDDAKFEDEVLSEGHQCHYFNLPTIFKSCDVLVAVWAIGSNGLALPENIGYPLDPEHGPKYFKMEIHYDNFNLRKGIRDSSGIRIFYTPTLRSIQAGILSVGIDPNWRHMIPPKQPSVVSYGHCISECTKKSLPSDGIHGFAFVLHSHLIGRKIKLRHIRDGEELAPIIIDNNYDFNYQEYRVLSKPVTILPGDHLIAECTYNSKSRDGITVGGFSTREEMCLVFMYHYPKINMSLCHSLPTMSTLYSSMGVEETWEGRIPPLIKKPTALANLTLKEHVSTYDWSKNYQHYQKVMRSGTFDVICGKHERSFLTNGTHHFPNIKKQYHTVNSCTRQSSGESVTHPKVKAKHDHHGKRHHGGSKTSQCIEVLQSRSTNSDSPSIKIGSINSAFRFGHSKDKLKYSSIIMVILFCNRILH